MGLDIFVRVLGWFLGHPPSTTNTSIRDQLIRFVSTVEAMARWLDSYTHDRLDSWKWSHPEIVDGAWGLGNTAYANAEAWGRLLYVILPNTLTHFDRYTHGWVTSLYDPQIETLHDEIDALTARVTALEQWRKDDVDPTIKEWRAFRDWFNDWPKADLYTLHAWLLDPSKFASWATPPLIGPTDAYYAAQEHKPSRDNLAQTMVNAWEEQPNVVLAAIEEWLLSS